MWIKQHEETLGHGYATCVPGSQIWHPSPGYTEPEWIILYNEWWTGTYKETENASNCLGSARYMQQIAAQFCAVPLSSPSSKIKTSQQIVQIMAPLAAHS